MKANRKGLKGKENGEIRGRRMRLPPMPVFCYSGDVARVIPKN
jgi:hypothetical protein